MRRTNPKVTCPQSNAKVAFLSALCYHKLLCRLAHIELDDGDDDDDVGGGECAECELQYR